MQSEMTKAADGTITLKITIPWKIVEEARIKVTDNLVKEVQVPGFRKGTAPKKVAEQHLKKDVVQEEVMKDVLGKAYNEAVQKEKLTPIITPRVHVDTFEDGTDLVFSAEFCEAPVVTLGDYKDGVKNITSKTKNLVSQEPSFSRLNTSSKSKIVIPGNPSAGSGQEQKPNVDEILNVIVEKSSVTIPKVLYEQEATRLLSQMLDELKTLGLSLDQYLTSRGKTAESLKAEYEEKAKKDLALEFVLRKIADTENITVEKTDIDGVIADIKDAVPAGRQEKQKQQLLSNPYFLASIIRQQKTLDFLTKI